MKTIEEIANEFTMKRFKTASHPDGHSDQEYPKYKPKLGVSVLITFISTLTDEAVFKVDELMKDGTFRFTTITEGIHWQPLPPKP